MGFFGGARHFYAAILCVSQEKIPPHQRKRTAEGLCFLTRNEQKLQLGACGDQSLALVVAGVLLKVLDEAGGQILSLLLPDGSIGVGVSGIQNVGVHAGQGSGNLEVEVGDLLGLSLQDGAIQNGVDDATGVLNGDTLAGAVPAGVDQVSLGAGLFHLLDQLFAVLGGVQLQESSAEAGGEGGSGLSDATLGAAVTTLIGIPLYAGPNKTSKSSPYVS